MPYYALVQPPDVLHLVPAEPTKEKSLLRFKKRFPNSKLRVDYLKNMLGLDDKLARNVHANWQRLDSVRWLQHVKTGELVPVVGVCHAPQAPEAAGAPPCGESRARGSASDHVRRGAFELHSQPSKEAL